jgi:trehalose/maltose hydrolase-like predicted phosphorylase
LSLTNGFNVTSNSSTVAQGYSFTLSGPVIVNKYVGIASTDAFQDPLSVAQKTSSQALSEGFDSLVTEHTAAWNAIWASADIEIPGNDEIQLSARTALFHLWSNIRNGTEGPGIGDSSIAPAGLTSDSYAGQIFWDADTFMYPGLLVLTPDFASSILNYRYKNLGAAMENAQFYNLSGALYPWTG